MNPKSLLTQRALPALALGALLASVMVACGGGGGGPSGFGTSGMISGTVSKGPVSGATVNAYALSNGVKGSQLGTAQTDASGDFTMAVGVYSGPMLLEVHGGSYMDEATGSPMNMLNADAMTCVLPSVTITTMTKMTGIQITPLTSLAQAWAQHMTGGMTMANITTANEQIGSDYLGAAVDIVMTHPIDPTVMGSANGASEDSTNYGMLLAAMSQEAHDLGMMQSSSAMVTALMSDASDGTMDGMMGTKAIDMTGMGGMMGGGNMMATAGTAQLAITMATFVNNPMNKSGVINVADMQLMIKRLNDLAASGGHL